jgi:DNA-binding MarR family transcriptional regulator
VSSSIRVPDADLFERLRDCLNRKTLASERHRAAMARLVGLSDKEAAAVAYLARDGQLTPSQLGELLALTSGGVTALTQRLERAGYISRRRHPTDRRSTILTATPEILHKASEHYSRLIADMDSAAARLEPHERALVFRYLEEIAGINERHATQLADRASQSEHANQYAAEPTPGLWA